MSKIKDFLISIKDSINIGQIVIVLVIYIGYIMFMINTINMVKEDNIKTVKLINKILKENNIIEVAQQEKTLDVMDDTLNKTIVALKVAGLLKPDFNVDKNVDK